MIRKIMEKIVLSTGHLHNLYIKICKPTAYEYCDFLKRKGKIHKIGENCAINPDCRIVDPYLLRIGNNVVISTCTILGHDGTIAMLNRAYNEKLDFVGPVDIKDNVFIGIGAYILPGVTIGPNAIVAAGSVVSRDVQEGSVVCGVPARKVAEVSQILNHFKQKTESYPWNDILQRREGSFDKSLEEELRKRRIEYFWVDE